MYSLLLVDDEPSVREAVRIMCDSDLYPIETIYEAPNGLVGLEMLKQYNPEIVFCDIKMPEMDGISFLRSAIADYPDTKFVILTAFDDFTYMREAIRLNVMNPLKSAIRRSIEIG